MRQEREKNLNVENQTKLLGQEKYSESPNSNLSEITPNSIT